MDGYPRHGEEFGKFERLITVTRELAEANSRLRSHPLGDCLEAAQLIDQNEELLRRSEEFLMRCGFRPTEQTTQMPNSGLRDQSIEDLNERSAELLQKSTTAMREAGAMSGRLASLDATSERLIRQSQQLRKNSGIR